jgi:hypothetical protein
MDNALDCSPDIDALERHIANLKKRFPFIIHTPGGYFSAYRKGKCSTASVVIAPDGHLYYPCHILGTKGPDLRTTDLTRWLATDEAKNLRTAMAQCTRNCGWYQYYSIDSYLSLFSVMDALGPMLMQKKRRPRRALPTTI